MAQQRGISGGTTAPSAGRRRRGRGKGNEGAQTGAQRPSVGGGTAITESRNPFIKGKRQGVRGQAVAQFKEKFKNSNPNTRHRMVEKIMKEKFGDTNWRKEVYGKGYKPGKVGNLNDRVKNQRDRAKELKTKIRETQAKASTATDETKSSIEKRLSELQNKESSTDKALTQSKGARDKLIGLRDKALSGIVAQSKSNPKQMSEARKRLVEEKLKKNKRPKGTSVA